MTMGWDTAGFVFPDVLFDLLPNHSLADRGGFAKPLIRRRRVLHCLLYPDI